MEPEHTHKPHDPHRKRPGWWRRVKKSWADSLVVRLFDWLTTGLLNLFFPYSERGRAYYGYAGPQRQNRVKWLWRRGRRLVRNSLVGSTLRTLRRRWFSALSSLLNSWWYPSQSHHQRNRLNLAWRSAARRFHSSWLGRQYQALTAAYSSRLYNWWYPHSHQRGHSSRRRSRLNLAWRSAKERFLASRLGRTWRALANAVYDWYFPVVKGSRYGYGYGHDPNLRMNRPERFVRHHLRRFRRTWLGLKLSWVLDEADGLASQILRSLAQDLAWPRLRRKLLRWQTWAIMALLIAATGYGYKYGLPRYRQFTENRYAGQAQLFAAKGDFSRAMLRARQVIALNPKNPVAIQIYADVAEFFGSPYALYWRQRLVFFHANATNRLALARTALRAESFPFPTATKALSEIAPASRQSSAYHLVAGALAIKLSDLTTAEQHYAEALKLNPDDPVNRMSLAVIRLQTGNPKLITDSRTTLELLRTDRQLGLLATRSLVAESVTRREFGRAELISQQILTNQQVLFSDRMVHLAILHVEKSPRFEAFFADTRKHAEEHPFYVGELASWMNRSGFARAGLDWLTGLPERLTRSGLVPIAVADTYVALGRWKELSAYLGKERWMELDAVRIGMMAMASRKEFGNRLYATYWQQAMRAGAHSPTTLNTLAEMAAGWGWQEETEEVLWFAVGQYPTAQWPLNTLEKLYTKQQSTAGLRRVFRTLVQKNPKDALARNNFAMVSLLLGADIAQSCQTAAELHQAQPDNPVFTSTHAFALYLQGRPQEAVSTLRTLGLVRLDDPALAAYYGVFLSAAGDATSARTYLNKSGNAFLLPEERALVERAKKTL